MNKTEKLLPSALDAAKKYITTDDEKLSVPKQFKGYISSFGASVIQSGLMPTLAFYSDAKKAKGDRSLLIPALIYMLFKNKIYKLIDDVQKELDALEMDKEKDLKSRIHIFFNWLLENNKDNPDKLRKEMMDASIALKLALRTFREVDTDKKKKS
jgi:CRISPR-associated protein Cmr5